jgi:hypothetical protein
MFDRAAGWHGDCSMRERSPALAVAPGSAWGKAVARAMGRDTDGSMTERDTQRHYDAMVDLLGVPQGERWDRVAGAIRRLDDERGRSWRMKLLLPDTPEEAAALPRLVAQLGHAGLDHDSVREPGGGQGIVVVPRERRLVPAAA